MPWKSWRELVSCTRKRCHSPVNRKQRAWTHLWLERLEDRLAPAGFDYSSGTLQLYTSAIGATMDVYKSSPTQVQVVAGAGDVWQGTDDASAGITGNGLTTLTIDTSLYTSEISFYPGGGDPTPETLTIHGGGAHAFYPAMSADYVANIVFTGGTVAFGGDVSLGALDAITVSSPVNAGGNLTLQANSDLTVNAPITSGVGDDITFSGANVTINAAVQSAAITSPAEIPTGYGTTGNISITASVDLGGGTLDLNAPVGTGQIGSLNDNIGPAHAGATGDITVTAGTVVGNAQGELSTGSTYSVGFGTSYYAPQSSGAIFLTATGDVTLAAPVALSTGDAIDFRDPITEYGGYPAAGEMVLQLSGNISADGASAPANLNFGLAEGATSDGNNNPTTGPLPLVGSNDELALGSEQGPTVGSGNIYLACTGNVDVEMDGLYAQANAHQAIDITTTGDMFVGTEELDSGNSQLSGDNLSLESSGGIICIVVLGGNGANRPPLDLGTGNLTLTADEINLSSGQPGDQGAGGFPADSLGSEMASDNAFPDAIAGTGNLVLQPATPGRNIAIGGDNTVANALNLSDNDLAAFAPGFKSFTIGRANDGTGTVDVTDNQTFGSPTAIYGGSITSQGVTSLTTTGPTPTNQWASNVIGFSSQGSATIYSAAQALGAPDTTSYGDSPLAWSPLSQNGTLAYLELGYKYPVYATGVTVQETDGNGFVYQVDLLDTNGNLHTVFTGTDNSQPGSPVGFNIPIPQTSYLVQGVKVYVNTDHDLNNYEEIDAVQLQGITANDLTLHARTGPIGGAVSTTTVYSVPEVPTSPLPDLDALLPAGSHYSAQVAYSADSSDGGGPVFTVLIDGVPALTQVGSLSPPTGPPDYLGYGSVDLEVDVPGGGAPVPTLHQITVSLVPAFLMGISSQSVTTTIPGGGANDPIIATAGGKLNLITDAGNGAGNIYVLSNHSLALQQNAFVTTGPGRNTISLQTCAGDITMPSSEPSMQANNLYLNAAGSVSLGSGLSLTAPVLSLIAGAALNLDLTQLYTTTIGDLTMQSVTTPIGASAAPLQVRVAGDLNLSSGSGVFATSAGALVVGNLHAGQGAGITTTAGSLTLAGVSGVSGDATLVSAGNFVSEGALGAGSLEVTAAGSITGGGLSASGSMTLTAGSTIGSAASPFEISAGTLNASAPGSIFITSLGSLTVATLTSTPGQTVVVTTDGVLTTLFSTGLFDDTVTLGGGGLVMQLPLSGALDFGADPLTLIGDTMSLNGPADSLKSTGTLNVQTNSLSQPITVGGTGGSGLDLTTNSINTLAPAFSSITIGRADFTNPVNIGGIALFSDPTTIIGSGFTQAGQGAVGTTGAIPLTLRALTGSIGGALAVLVNVGGVLDLIANALNGAAAIFVSSAHALTLGQNVAVTTAPGRDSVDLATSSGDITVPLSFTSSDNWTLQPTSNVAIADGATITAASLNLNAGGTLVLGPTTQLVTSLGDMSLQSAGASIGTRAQPVHVRVAGKLNLTTTNSNVGDADVYATSPVALVVGSLSTGVLGSVVNITTTTSGITLAVASTLNGLVTLSSAGSVGIAYVGTFQAATLSITAAGAIAGNGVLATTGFLTLNAAAGDIGASGGPLMVNVGNVLNASATGNIYVTSPQHALTVATLNSTPGHAVAVATTGIGILTTLFGTGLTGDNVTLDGGSGGLTMESPASPALDFGSGAVTLTADTMLLSGGANSLKGTGSVLVQTHTAGFGLNLTASLGSAFAPGFSSITIGRPDGTNPVTITDHVSFGSPTTIIGSTIADALANLGQNTSITTTGANDLTLHAHTGEVGDSLHLVNANVGGKLNVITDAAGADGSIYIRSAQSVTLGVVTTGPGAAVVDLETTAGDVTVPASLTGDDNLFLIPSAGDLTIANGVTLSEASLVLGAGGTVVTGPTTKLVTTSGDLDLSSHSAALGASANPINVTVAGQLRLGTSGSGGANGDAFVTSAGTLNIGYLSTGPDPDTIHIGTTNGADINVDTNITVNDDVTIAAAGNVAVAPGLTVQADSLTVNAGLSIVGGIFNAVGNVVNNFFLTAASGSIGTANNPVTTDTTGDMSLTSSSDQNVDTTNPNNVLLNNDNAGGSAIHIDGGDFATTSGTTIDTNSSVVVSTGGTLDISTHDTTVASATVLGGQIISSGGRFVALNGFILWDGEMAGISGNTPVTKQGDGTATVSGNNPNAPTMSVNQGTVILAPNVNYGGNIIVPPPPPGDSSTPTLKVGSNSAPTAATANSVEIQTKSDLNSDPAILRTAELKLDPGSTLSLLGNTGTTPGSGYNQIVVNGPVIVSNANFNWTFAAGFTPAAGASFDIIQNNGGSAISGTFSGLPEGSVFTADGVSLRISYLGGVSGHDVTLTVAGAPPTITGITPSLAGGTLPADTSLLQVAFSEPVVGADVTNNYQLQSAGPDGLLGTDDDVIVPITSVSFSGATATLNFPALPEGFYRLTVDSTITDASGVALDGNGDGTSGDNDVVDFISTATGTTQLNSPGTSFNMITGGVGAGELAGNTAAGYELLNHLQVGGIDYTPVGAASPVSNAQDLLAPIQTIAGLNVSRLVTVPTGGGQDFTRTVEILQNPTGSAIATTVKLISNLGTGSAANVFATSSGAATPSVNDQWVGTQNPGGPAIVHYIHGPAGLTPTVVSVVGDNIEWTYSISVPAGQIVELGEFSIVNSTQAGAIADANALVASTGFGGDAGDFLSPADLAALANIQFVAPPVADAGGPYSLKEGSSLTLDGSASSDAAGYPLQYTWTINGQANAATGVNPTLTYTQLQALGINVGGTYSLSVAVSDGHGASTTAGATLNVVFGDPAKLVFEPSTNNAAAGQTIPAFNVDVLDQLGTLINTNTSTVTIAITTPGGASFSAGTLNVPAAAGVVTFGDLAIQQAGTYTLTASDGNLAQAVSMSFTIGPGPIHQLAFETTANGAVAGQTIPAFKVDVEDQYGNVVPGDTSTVVVALHTGPAGGSITSGTFSAGAISSVATFADLVIQKAGAYTLVATDGSLTQAISASFAIDHDVAQSLVFENTSNNAASGQTIPAFQVDVLDQFGNPVTNDTSAVSVSLNSDPPGQQFASGTLQRPVSGGVAAFSDLVISGSGTYALAASDGFLAPAFSAAFSVTAPLQVTVNPTNQTAFSSQTAVFTAASANPSDAVQWQVNKNDGNGFTNIGGAGTTTLTVSNLLAAENGYQYRAVFSNALSPGSLATNAATLSVDSVATAPTAAFVNASQTAVFTAASTNPAGTDTIQWQVNQNDGNGFNSITGATTTTLTVSNAVASEDGYWYRAVFSNAGYSGALTTSQVALRVDEVTANPGSSVVNAGQTVTFIAASANPLNTDTVQWQVNANDGNGFTNVNGATSTTLTLTNVASTQNGDLYRAAFANSAGALTSAAATLTVDFANIASGPANLTVNVGQTATFTAAANANPAATVQWQISTNNGSSFTNIGGATSTTLTLAAVTGALNGDQYQADFSTTGVNAAILSATTTPATLTVNRVAATITITPYSGAYDAHAHGIAGTALGIFSDDVSNLLNLGATFTSAGHYVVNWSFAGNADYLPSGGTSTVDIAKANATIVVTPYHLTYDTAAHTAAGAVMGVDSGGAALGSTLTLGGTTHTHAGTYGDTWTFAGGANYNDASNTVTDIINQANVTVTWSNPADITFGTPLGANQLNATADVPGTISYTLADGSPLENGALLNAGPGQTLNAYFTPTDAADYAAAMDAVTITVRKATPTIAWGNPADLTYGDALGATQLNATASTMGNFTYTLADGATSADNAVLNASLNQTLNVAFVPTDTSDFNAASDSVLINVQKATPTIAWNNPADITYGAALAASQLNATANVAGAFSYTLADGTTTANDAVLNAGQSQVLNALFTPTDLVDYRLATKSVAINVEKANQTIQFDVVSPAVYSPAAIMLTATGGASRNSVTFSLISGPGIINGDALTPTGIGAIVVEADQMGNNNYLAAPAIQRSLVITATYANSTSAFENGAPAVVTVSKVLGTDYSDPDGSANTKPGMAVFQTGGSGTWQYSTNATAWTAISSVSPTQALLLPGGDSLRFVSAANTSGQANLYFVAWDGSQGKAGSITSTVSAGGTTAFSTSAGDLAHTINPTPIWIGAGAHLTAILPGTHSATGATPAGNSIASVFGGYFHDDNAAIPVGVAIVGVTGATSGVWQYLPSSAGAAWTKFPTVSTTAALPLSASDQVRFVPNQNFTGIVSLTALAWDGSAGTVYRTGSPAKLGSAAFSPTTLTVTGAIMPAVAAGNHAPVLITPAINGAPVAVNATGAAVTVSSLLTAAGYSDPDGKKLPQGIAVIDTLSTVGAFQYMLSGGAWQPLLDPSSSAALLLPSNASLRLVAGGQLGAAMLTFDGWDETQGAAGQVIDIAGTGGANAFSAVPSTLSIAVRQASAWNASSGANLPTLAPGVYSTTPPAGSTVASVFGSFFEDVSPNVTVAIAVVGLTGSGVWQYSSDDISWSTFTPTPSNKAAILLSGADYLRFVPKDNTATTATLKAYAWDGTGGFTSGANLTQTGAGGATPFSATTLTAACVVNTAPTLAPQAVVISAIKESAIGPALTGASLLKAAGYADPDGKSVPSGIAITGDTGPGVWQYLNGSIWTGLPVVSSTSAFLLPSTASVRFDPADNLAANDSATLTYIAWDQTAGAADTIYAVTNQGGTTAFSTQSAVATMPVNFVKQAPSWAAGSSAVFTPVLGLSVSNSAPNPAGNTVASIFGNAFTDAAGVQVHVAITAQNNAAAGAWQIFTNGQWTALPAVSMTSALLLSGSDMLRFLPNKNFSGTVTLTAHAWDGTGNFNGAANLIKSGTGGATPFSSTSLIAVCPVNTAPNLT